MWVKLASLWRPRSQLFFCSWNMRDGCCSWTLSPLKHYILVTTGGRYVSYSVLTKYREFCWKWVQKFNIWTCEFVIFLQRFLNSNRFVTGIGPWHTLSPFCTSPFLAPVQQCCTKYSPVGGSNASTHFIFVRRAFLGLLGRKLIVFSWAPWIRTWFLQVVQRNLFKI